ncbi:MAG: hypothetical protein A2729_04020 [Candidatus Buchananbacteria bacterium RIFCSPHIGHO2_01_FULL_39_14]|uniref:Glycosyl transferase family 1 domain-containing protein n=2 Tax=Candidatus Buchananiibacteriota TaxID=1817903 RepID=A0A1G1YWU1_9BACT|nr:MAG: hypothetical protein A2729_04020 [Candidatus Buchananbacteria bacterium RIFCSPHIGHO2_01_FULL_39_14]OGY48635.1 MAG: hypothetical protein A3D39_05215 [Candidatus Buchananbacteria bacterium RIFCSPHIGHO2_02_FULL_39_17]OGY56060.1 MAG: hypothetical protein A2912_03595 [Candidatus Buchananbacteria bacterium RIFCSPLOWO2_01_FULL_40_23b]
MHLLVITRKIDHDDPRVGFVSAWANELKKSLKFLTIIAWQESRPEADWENIRLISLPKNKILKIFWFQYYLIKILPKVDGVFCHMNPEYTILAAPSAKIFRKKIVSWYTHGTVSWRLKIMEKLTNQILTASKASFRLRSRKLVVTGHGIDLKTFYPIDSSKSLKEKIQLISVGRISPTKDYETIIKAVNLLNDQGFNYLNLKIIGEIGLAEQQVYFNSLKTMTEKMNLGGKVEFLGAIKHVEIPDYLRKSDIFINLSGTGGLDKAVLEAMACGCLVLTSNEAFREILPTELIVGKNNPKMLSEKIKWLVGLSSDQLLKLRQQLQEEIIKNHNLTNLSLKIISQFS